MNTETDNGQQVRSNDLLGVIGGVLSYSTAGHGRACGQVIGANGAGDFCVIFTGSPDEAAETARQFVRRLEHEGHREVVSIFTPNDDLASYHGNPITVMTPNT